MNYQQSEKIDALALALVKAQAKFPIVHKDSTNPHFRSKFASLDAILKAVIPVLGEFNLSLCQIPISDGDYIGVRTQIQHGSGQFISGTLMIKPAAMGDAQKAGAIITYFKRYGLAGMLGISTDEDDDGNSAQPQPVQQPQQQPAPQRQPLTNYQDRAPVSPGAKWEPKYGRPTGQKAQEQISEGSAKYWFIILKECGWTQEEAKQLMLNQFGVTSHTGFNKEQFWDFEMILRHNSFQQYQAKLQHKPAHQPPQNDIPPANYDPNDVPF